MDHTNVIIKPLVTEKSAHQQNTRNIATFMVQAGANKPQIKSAIESIYSVKVADVRTMVRKGKPRRSKFKTVKGADWKRAIVVLEEGSKIELF